MLRNFFIISFYKKSFFVHVNSWLYRIVGKYFPQLHISENWQKKLFYSTNLWSIHTILTCRSHWAVIVDLSASAICDSQQFILSFYWQKFSFSLIFYEFPIFLLYHKIRQTTLIFSILRTTNTINDINIYRYEQCKNGTNHIVTKMVKMGRLRFVPFPFHFHICISPAQFYFPLFCLISPKLKNIWVDRFRTFIHPLPIKKMG